MKWYKHISGSLDDPDISDAVDIFGSDGYLLFFRILELLSIEFDVDNPGISTFSANFLKKKIPISYKKIVEVLKFFNERDRLLVEFHNGKRLDMVTINCPKLKDLTDSYTTKILNKRDEQTSNNVSRDDEQSTSQEEDKEVEQDNKEQPAYREPNNKDNKTGKNKQVDTNNKYIKEIICYLNDKLNTNYKASAGKTRDLIKTRMKEGFTVEDFKTVIDKKWLEWGDDPKWSYWLRPITLFSNKFESYLNQITVKEKSDLQRRIEKTVQKYGEVKDD